MKKILITFIIIVFLSCKDSQKNVTELQYASFGDSISAENAIDAKDLLPKYQKMKEGDTLNLKINGIIKEVCQKKGCWVTIELQDSVDTFVKFKDYGFFIPINASGSKAILNGKAFITTESVASLRHYAKDEGKSEAEINTITKPEITYSFLADGVLIEKFKK
ncbi:MAG: DUF4920 domain-containing protein [Flavobacterium sp.]